MPSSYQEVREVLVTVVVTDAEMVDAWNQEKEVSRFFSLRPDMTACAKRLKVPTQTFRDCIERHQLFVETGVRPNPVGRPPTIGKCVCVCISRNLCV